MANFIFNYFILSKISTMYYAKQLQPSITSCIFYLENEQLLQNFIPILLHLRISLYAHSSSMLDLIVTEVSWPSVNSVPLSFPIESYGASWNVLPVTFWISSSHLVGEWPLLYFPGTLPEKISLPNTLFRRIMCLTYLRILSYTRVERR